MYSMWNHPSNELFLDSTPTQFVYYHAFVLQWTLKLRLQDTVRVCGLRTTLQKCFLLVTRVPKNTYPVRTEHALQFRVLHVQQVPRLVAGILHCTCKSAYIHTCITLKAALAQRVWCAVKAHKKIFQGQGPSCLIWKGMNCSVCTACWT